MTPTPIIIIGNKFYNLCYGDYIHTFLLGRKDFSGDRKHPMKSNVVLPNPQLGDIFKNRLSRSLQDSPKIDIKQLMRGTCSANKR